MSSIVPYYILTLLGRQDSVRIPGIGVLSRHRHAARLDDEQRRIFPPRAEASFEASETTGNQLLAGFISYKTGLDQSQANGLVREFADQIRDQVAKGQAAEFPGFGTFVSKDGKLGFNANDKSINFEYDGLENLTLPRPVPAGKVAKEDVAGVQQMVENPEESAFRDESAGIPPDQKPGKRRRRVPLFVIMAVGLFTAVCALAYWQYLRQGPHDAPVADTGNEVQMTDTVDRETQTDTSTQLSVAQDDTGPHFTDTVEGSGFTDPTEPYNIVSPEDTAHALPPDTAEVPVRTDTAQRSAEEELNITDTAGMRCVVIVGAFGVPSNVDRMVLRLRDMGYDPVTIPVGQLMQVGVPQVCGSTALSELKRVMRTHVEQDAWVLKR